jgi:two-component system, LuxR family, response regulator FixJ
MKEAGLPALTFASAEEFLTSGEEKRTACLVLDIRMPGMSGLELQAKLNEAHQRIPIIFITALLPPRVTKSCDCKLSEQEQSNF